MRRAVGLALLLAGGLPLYRFLDPARTGLPGASAVEVAEDCRSLALYGTVLILIPALLAGRYLRPETGRAAAERLAGWLLRPPLPAYALALAVVSTVLTATFSLLALGGRPDLIDGMVQLAQARLFSSGRLAGLGGPLAGAWTVQNALVTPNGWVSQYPPGYALLLAPALAAGVPWLVGPLLLGATSFFSALALHRLLAPRVLVARIAAALTAVCPFLIFLAGDYMSHVAAAALAMAALWCALRARDGAPAWAAACGAAGGLLLAVRPLSAVAVGAAPVLAVWLAARRAEPGWWARRLAWAAAGAAPFAAGLLAWNAHFFGSPFRFGYEAALGGHMLGFGVDPWGNTYGVREAIGFTAADLTTLGQYLLETPIPVVAAIGGWLLATRRMPVGSAVILTGALAPVLANAFYWHHGQFMGPRMLDESAPYWVVLCVLAAAGLVARAPAASAGVRFSPRVALAAALTAALSAGLLWLGPQRGAGYAAFRPSNRMSAPSPDAPALVFVHGAWTERLASRLAADGVRLDSVEAALRRNATCDVQRVVDAGAERQDPRLLYGRVGPSAPLAHGPPDAGVRIAAGKPFPAAGVCAAEAAADRHGVYPLAPLLWQGVPPGSAGGVVFVRDLGPAANARVLESLAGRTPWLLASRSPEALPVLQPYEQGMRLLWGTAVKRLDAVRAAALTGAVAAAVHAPALANGFAYDDVPLILGDPRLRAPMDFAGMLSRPYWGGTAAGGLAIWRPLTTLSFALDRAVFAFAPAGFHLTNILLHVCASALVVLLLARWFEPTAALVGGLLFAVHPVHVEAVADVAGRAELLSAVLVLGAALAWTGRRTSAAWGLAGLAVLSKESAVVVVPIYVLVDLADGRLQATSAALRRWLRETRVGWLGLVAVLAAWLSLRAAVVGGINPAVVHPVADGLGPLARRLTALQAWPVYARLLFFPRVLLADYGPRVIMPARGLTPGATAGLLVLIALVVGGVAAAVRDHRRAAVGLLWFPATILPVSNLVVTIGVLVAERTLYLPSVAVAILAAGTAEAVLARAADGAPSPVRRAAAVAAATVMIGAMAGRSVVRIPDWRSTDAVFGALLRDRPDAYRGHWYLGRRLRMSGDLQGAAREMERAVALWPGRHRAVIEAAATAAAAGDAAGARRLAGLATERWPADAVAWRIAAAAALDQGDVAAARTAVDGGLRADPRDTLLLRMRQTVSGLSHAR